MPNSILLPPMHSTHLSHCIAQVLAALLKYLFKSLSLNLLLLNLLSLIIQTDWLVCGNSSCQLAMSVAFPPILWVFLTESDGAWLSVAEHCKYQCGHLDLADLMLFDLAVVILGVAWLDGGCKSCQQFSLHAQILTHCITPYPRRIFSTWHKIWSFRPPSYFFLPSFFLFFWHPVCHWLSIFLCHWL